MSTTLNYIHDMLQQRPTHDNNSSIKKNSEEKYASNSKNLIIVIDMRIRENGCALVCINLPISTLF